MAKILCEERVVEDTKEFKIKVVELTQGLSVKAIDIAEILDLHPMMVYRWRQEYREGKLIAEPSRRISMTTKHSTPPPNKQQKAEFNCLKKDNARLKKEVDLLKK
jgi:transposase